MRVNNPNKVYEGKKIEKEFEERAVKSFMGMESNYMVFAFNKMIDKSHSQNYPQNQIFPFVKTFLITLVKDYDGKITRIL